MKRFSMAICLSCLISIFLIGSPYAAAAVVSEILDSNIRVGDIFHVNVTLTELNADNELLAFGFDVDTPQGLNYIGANVDAQFTDDSLLLPDTDVAGSAFPALSGGDDIILTTLNFEAVSVGTHPLNIVSDLGDPNEGLFTLLNGRIDLTSSVLVNVVPVPGALLLFGSALFGIVRLVNFLPIQK